MCGIAGYVGWERTHADSERELGQMCAAIRHRGPDDEGHFIAPGVALGMRRLSVIDVAGGMQPVANEDGSVHVVFNGEIYNYRELRAGLVQRGHGLVSQGDTETLVHLYEEQGDRLVHALRGMFAFAMWDSGRQRLLLARDRLGIKPLYYWETPSGLAFASELRSFLALEPFPRLLASSALGEYLALGYVPQPQSVFAAAKKLSPGHLLSWDREHGVRVTEYWSPVRAEMPRIDEHEAVEELQRLLAESVRYHLEADVPLGAFLSGGIDSSAVVAHMNREMGGSRRVRTFSIGFDEPEFNEAPHAAAVAQALGTDHTELIVRPDADELVEDVVRAFDEPFADSSALPTYLVSRLAREQVTVALSGDGGDELFGGYTRYTELLGRHELQPAALRHFTRTTARHLPHASPGRNRLLDLSRTRRGRYAATVAAPLGLSDGGVALSHVAEELGAFEAILDSWFDQAASRDREGDFAAQMMLVDIMSYLPGDILTKVDRMSMAVSLEARVPLLDHRVVEFATSLPTHLKIRDGTGKWILRQAIASIVPAHVLHRPKRGFAVPVRRWLRGELRHRITHLLRKASPVYEFVDASAVQRIAGEHRLRRRDHSSMLWRLLVLDLWLESLASGQLMRPTPTDASLRGVTQHARAS
ncbi:MAG TPA: asparagine synthase (glutamine-hydrolyzing) [Gemmatimonadaceae bacterium]